MNNGIVITSLLAPIFIIFVFGMLMPMLTRKELFFGVRIPSDKIGDESLNKFKARYFRDYLLICGIFTSIFVYIALKNIKNPIIYISGSLILIVLGSVIYYMTHSRVKAFKKSQGWTIGKKETVVVDTSFRGDKSSKLLVSPLWFLIPLTLIALNLTLGLITYESLPDRIPMHYNIMGEVDRWADKSLEVILQQPMIQFFLTGLMYFTYKKMGLVKQQINPSNPEESLHQNRVFRRMWSGYTIFINTCVVIIFTIINFNIMKIINLKGTTLNFILVLILVIILLSTIALSLYTGQGGSRIKIKKPVEEDASLMDRDDDRHWKLGMFYFNPNDPAVWVEKRFGIGFTINFARPIGIFFLIGIIVFIVLVSILTK